MKQMGRFKLARCLGTKSLKANVYPFAIQRGAWRADFKPGQFTNGATFPPGTSWLFGGKLNKDFDLSTFVHDRLCGELSDPHPVYNVDTKEERILTWKEAAVWFRDCLKLEDRSANGKLRRRVFYHAVMMKKRIGQKK